jgi:hypothetical protein
MCHTKELVYSGSLLRLALCGIMWSRDVPLLHPSHPPPPPKLLTPHPLPRPLQTQSISSLAEGWTWIGTHQEGSRAAKSVISRCQTMSVNIVIYFPSDIIFMWRTPQIFFLLSIDCSYLFRLTNHNDGIKASMHSHLIIFSWLWLQTIGVCLMYH